MLTQRLATLLEGVNNHEFQNFKKNQSFIVLGGLKCEKLENNIDTMLYWLADRLLLLKCYDKKWLSYRGVPL